jgi:uncharacterized membrane-anchored protein
MLSLLRFFRALFGILAFIYILSVVLVFIPENIFQPMYLIDLNFFLYNLSLCIIPTILFGVLFYFFNKKFNASYLKKHGFKHPVLSSKRWWWNF